MAKNALQNLNELNKAYKKFIELSTKDIADSLERTGFKFFQTLQVETPKDTSRAVNGWIPTIDTNAPSEWKPPKGLSSYAPLSFPFGKTKFDSLIWIANNVEYIQYLEEGHSQQAPYGFINDALRQTTAFIESETSKLNRKKYNV